ncbi:sialic acid-binding Ig-like lectin 12 [Notolabrus celidotus]|uniref:sialic acid-binding Ig-like lectin 12 n=1 Tax=Notolabrus celidotus TaxID=1203425 RepID=UPI00148F710A|nr:sialic acid-binding Ig-like lectin 12 [Notolabrus celidotus]
MSVPSFLSVSMSANMFLIVLFVPGARTQCPERSDLFITSPQRMEALNGSCLLIPCNFSARYKEGIENQFVSTRETFGLWAKDNTNNLVFNSSGTVLKYPISITGDLKEKNCTTLFSNVDATFKGIYYFRIMNWPFRATGVCDPLTITVRDSPHRPSMEIPGDLKEKESVTITCSALTPCPHSPPKLTWSLQRDSLNNMEENTDGTFTTQIQESITLSEHHDGYNITCSATYPVNEGRDVRTAEETKTLSVSYAPKNTSVSISPSGLVSAGTLVNLTCSSRAKPPVSRFTWFRISNNRPVMVSEGESYSLNVTEGGVYYCMATSHLGNQTSSRIHLSTPGFLIWGSAVGGIIVITLICLAVWFWWFKSKHQGPQATQSQRDDTLTLQQPTSQSEDSIHYGEIHFSVRRPEPLSVLVQDSGQEQDSVYAQVKVSQPASSRTQTDDSSPEDLYAQVKKQ